MVKFSDMVIDDFNFLYRAAWKLSAAFFYLFAVFFRRSFRIRRFTLETASSVASGLEWDFTT